MDAVTLGRIVHYVEKNPRLETTPGAPATVDRAAIVTVVHDDPNPDDRVDLTVFTPSGPILVSNVTHVEPDRPAVFSTDTPPKPGTPGTWHWPERK